ncbi:MAG: NAD(P)/FAD-dependent oxidoreductase [Bacteroidota bacterium]
MKSNNGFDVIIVGGSYSGLSAAMALGRSLRNILIIDSGLPCNRQTPHSHNFITHDGEQPAAIAEKAKAQVLQYDTVRFLNSRAINGKRTENSFTIITDKDEVLSAKKLVFATGVKDIMPDIDGFSACWGISVIHCPYCHGYEVKNEKTGILANGDIAFHYAQLIRNWTKDLTIFTNGKSTLTAEQTERIERHGITVVEKEIRSLKHEKGQLEQVVFKDQSAFDLTAIYARPDFEQHCKIPEQLGCELTEQGLLTVSMFQKTTVDGIFACGDNSSPLRAVSHAAAAGTIAGAALNNEMTEEEF